MRDITHDPRGAASPECDLVRAANRAAGSPCLADVRPELPTGFRATVAGRFSKHRQTSTDFRCQRPTRVGLHKTTHQYHMNLNNRKQTDGQPLYQNQERP